MVEETLRRLLVVRTGGPIDAYWHLTIDFDPEEKLRQRRRQKVYMAYYGKESMLGWGDVDVGEMNALHEELSDMIERQNEANAAAARGDD